MQYIYKMTFNIYSELSYEVFSPTTFIFNIQAARSANQVIIEESLCITPNIAYEEFNLDNVDARFIRLFVNRGVFFTISYKALVDVSYMTIPDAPGIKPIATFKLDKEVIPFLFPSRHCQSDKLRKLAIKQFGNIQNEYFKVLAINEWIFKNIDYITGATDSGTSAYDSLIQREGVCKDFAHLGIALCRAVDIPARYFTGYASNLNPPDFHACFEAYIGGHWLFFDPTKLVPINGLVKIANSKDAGDAAVASFFGNTNCTYMNVWCNPVDADFRAFVPGVGKKIALSYS